MSKSTRGARVAGIASLAVTLSIGVAAPAFAAAGFEFSRIAGDDRYETAADASEQYGASDDVIIANGQPGEYADALAGNYLAGAEDAPILLTKRSGIPDVTMNRLETIDPTNVWIVGGEAAVPADQEAELEAAGYNVTRVAGDDRFGTNAEVIAADGASTGGVGLIATGLNFPDALAAGPFAYKGHSLGLVRTNRVPDAVGDALEADGVTKVLIFGGTDVVGAGVVSDLAARGITVEQRFAGADRSETSELAAEWAVANLKFSDEHVGVASGYTEGYGADALAGGPVEGNENSPMLITRNVDNPDDVLDYLKKHCPTLADGHIYGGPAAISATAEAAMTKAATECAGASAVDLPELTAASIVGTVTAGQASPTNPAGTVVRFTFDEAFNTANASNFFVTATNGTDRYTGNTVVASTSTTVDVRFNAVDSTTEAAALTVATVDNGAVSQTDGDTNPEGDAPLGTTSGGGTVNLPAGTTVAPDLLSVPRVGDTATGAGTVVDFTFDEAANTATNVASAFQVHLINGDVYDADIIPQAGDGPSGENNPGGDGTTTITVQFSEDFTAAQVARGTVAEGAVSEATDNESPLNGTDANELQAAPVSSGSTTAPDLVSVELRPDTDTDGTGPDEADDADKALFTFDQNVLLTADPTDFFLYRVDGTKTAGAAGVANAEVNTANRTQVLVTFTSNTATDRAVGGNVLAGAVTAENNGQTNSRDEEGVANTDTTSTQTSGKTAGPDLTGVKVALEKDTFGNTTGTDATYTFDEDVNTADSTKFFLFLKNGTKVAGSGCVKGSTEATDNTVTCEFSGVTGDLDREFDAAIGTVDYQAVTAEDAGPGNPEGAEPVTR